MLVLHESANNAPLPEHALRRTICKYWWLCTPVLLKVSIW